MYGYYCSFPIFLKNMMAAVNSYKLPSVFLQKFEQVFVFNVLPPFKNIMPRVVRIINKNLKEYKNSFLNKIKISA